MPHTRESVAREIYRMLDQSGRLETVTRPTYDDHGNKILDSEFNEVTVTELAEPITVLGVQFLAELQRRTDATPDDVANYGFGTLAADGTIFLDVWEVAGHGDGGMHTEAVTAAKNPPSKRKPHLF